MTRKKKPGVEIVPASETALVPKRPAESPQAVLDRMVRERVDEIMAERGSAPMESDFQPKEVAFELQRRQTVFERRKWPLYFEKWGCRKCERKRVAHMSTGQCAACHSRLQQRLAAIKRDFDKANPDQEIERKIDQLTSRFRSAQALLGELEE
jgi:Zn finger protein HypA/HybF involved in hydrogenase expression